MFRGQNRKLIRLCSFSAITIGLIVILVWKYRSLLSQNWGFGATIIIVMALVFLYLGFENSVVSTREIGVIAVLATVAAVGRVPLTFLPSVQATTFLVIVAGFVFGPRAGFMVGATAALVSNFFLGQGPWTPIQMLAWGLVGTSAGILGILIPNAGRIRMSIFSFVWGYAFGWLMNLWFWSCFVQPLTWSSFLATYAVSLPFDTLHALCNIAFYLIFGPHVIKILKRFRRKCVFSIEKEA